VSPRVLNAAVFASGGGTNFQALIDREGPDGEGSALWRTRVLVVDRGGIGAIERAKRAGVPVCHMPVSGRDPKELGDATLAVLAAGQVEVIFLAGYLRLVPSAVTAAFRRRILNVHPALLPEFGGKGMWGRSVHEAVLRSGAKRSGATVHYVDDRYDEGAVLAQWPVPVAPGDDADALAARVLAVEHLLYPLTAQHVCQALAHGEEPAPLPPPDDADPARLATLVQRAFRSR
jgi:formyltetrahydrofolate-dependent phosphoribosylglycinamide formyltransferase